MSPIDWIFVAITLALVVGIGVFTQRYIRSVADFLSGGRLARRYLLAVGRAEMNAGVVTFVGIFEAINHSGFSLTWWGWPSQMILLVVAIFGFVIYRYRETRAMTLGQFFEIRYSRNLRLFAGSLGFFAGLMNFGIMPVVGAKAMVYFLGIPPSFPVLGIIIPAYIPLMATFLLINLFVASSGGIVTIMITSCVEGILSQILYLAIIIGLICIFSWPQISSTLGARPSGQSLLNPIDTFQTPDFNIWMILMALVWKVYGTMAWQNQSAYNSAPLTAHEGVMGGLLGSWRGMGQAAVITLLAVCAMTYLHDPAYSAQAGQVHMELAKISNPQTKEQMELPIAVTHMLPVGLRGALCAVLLLGIFGADSSHLHSWGSLFIQDIIMPLRRTAFSPEQHLRLLRWAIAGVALFVFVFGLFFPLVDYIIMWWSVTMGIYISGAGSAIIGGLYWKKATTAGAWAAFATGFVLSMAGIGAQLLFGKAFPLNGVHIAFFSMLISIVAFVLVSLLTSSEEFNLDRMLHRGIYSQTENTQQAPTPHRFNLSSLIGCDENFTLADKWMAWSVFLWTLLFFVITVAGTAWCLIRPWSLDTWSTFWHVNIVTIPVIMVAVTGAWFTWGGITDMIDLFRRLRKERINPLDDGFVVDHQNRDEIAAPVVAGAARKKETTAKAGPAS